MVHYTLFSTPIGDCGVAWRAEWVVGTYLPEQSPEATATRMAARFAASKGNPPPAIASAIASMTALLEGAKVDLTGIECDLSGVESFPAKVYAVTRAIPPGETLTYGAIAEQLGDKRLAQAVGKALGRNPLPIIVPCHRVIGAKGKLTGFSAHGGIQTKLKMLSIEGARLGEGPDLFDDLPLC